MSKPSPYIVRYTGPAILQPGTTNTSFAVNLTNYVRAKVYTMFVSPDTYQAQAILQTTGALIGLLQTVSVRYMKKRIGKYIRSYLRTRRELGIKGPKYRLPLPSGVITAIIKKILSALHPLTSRAARALLHAMRKLITDKLYEMLKKYIDYKTLLGNIEMFLRIGEREIKRINLRKLARVVGRGTIMPAVKLRSVIGVILDLIMQIIIETLIDIMEYSCWPTYGVVRTTTYNNLILCCGPNVASTLMEYFGISFSNKYMAIYTSWTGSKRTPMSRLIKVQSKLAHYMRGKLDPAPHRRWSYSAVFRKPYIKWWFHFKVLGHDYGEIFDKCYRELPSTVAGGIYRARGTLKIYVIWPLIGCAVGEAIARELCILMGTDDNDAFQGYTYITSAPTSTTAVLDGIDRQVTFGHVGWRVPTNITYVPTA